MAGRARPLDVGVLGYLANRGLGYDAVLLRQALGEIEGVRVSFFPVTDVHLIDRPMRRGRLRPAEVRGEWRWPEAERELDLAAWVREREVVIVLEGFPVEVLAVAVDAGVRIVHVPNLEWIPDREGWRDFLGAADVVVAKTALAGRALRNSGLSNVVDVPWTVPVPIEKPRPTGTPVTFFHAAGAGGSNEVKNPAAVVRAFQAAFSRRDDVRLLLSLQVPAARRKVTLDLTDVRGARNVEVHEGALPRAEFLSLFRRADVGVFPSRMEGFGLPILESLHLGLPVVTVDAPPMNEPVRDGVNGLLVPAVRSGRHRHVPLVEVDPDALAAALGRLADPAFTDRLKAGTAEGLADRARAFRAGLDEVLEKVR